MLKNIDVSVNRLFSEVRQAIVGNLILTKPEPGVVILFHKYSSAYYIKHVVNVQNYTVDLFRALKGAPKDSSKDLDGVPICVMQANSKCSEWQVWVYYTKVPTFVNTFHSLLAPYYGHLMTARGGLDKDPRCLCIVGYEHGLRRYVSVHVHTTAEEIESLANKSLLRGLLEEERLTTAAWGKLRWLYRDKSATAIMKALTPITIGRYDPAIVNHRALPAEIRRLNDDLMAKFAINHLS